MTDYRAVSRHVRYWRGQVHKWSTVYPLTGSISPGDYFSALTHIHEMEQAVCYPAPGGAGGGNWEVALYDQATGGVPIQVITYFDPEIPGDWIPYTGTAWSSLTTALEGNAEVALQVEWLAGLSRTGKPVSFRKWYHAVPQLASGNTAPDVNSTNRTAIAGTIQANLAPLGGLGLLLGNGRRLAAATPLVSSFFGNHQMPRGRRRLVRTAARPASSFPPGLLVVPGSDGSLSV